MSKTALRFILASLSTCLLYMSAYTQEDSDARDQEETFNILAEEAYDKGAYIFSAQYIDTVSPSLWAEIDGQPAELIYDTGASNLVLFDELFETTPAQEQADIGVDLPLQTIEPPNIKLHPSGDSFQLDKTFAISWSEFGLPDYVRPFHYGLMPQLYWDGKAAAFEHHPKERWFALFPSPHTPAFDKPFEIKLEVQQETFAVALIDIKLPGQASAQTVKLLVDTGYAGDIELKSNLFPADYLWPKKDIISSMLNGLIEGWRIGGVEIMTGNETILLNRVDVVEDIKAVSSAYKFDGLIGAQFLNRFNHVIDMSAGVLILDLADADFSPSAPYIPGTPYTVSHETWEGAVIIDPRDWADAYNVREADIIASVNDKDIIPELYSTMLSQAVDPDTSNKVCIFRPKTDTEKADAFCFETNPQDK